MPKDHEINNASLCNLEGDVSCIKTRTPELLPIVLACFGIPRSLSAACLQPLLLHLYSAELDKLSLCMHYARTYVSDHLHKAERVTVRGFVDTTFACSRMAGWNIG